MRPDPRLIAACIREERKAQSELYQLCYGTLMGVCMRYCRNRDDAAAALNLGFLKLLKGLKGWKEHVPFEAWARRIMINTLIDEFRRSKSYRSRFSIEEELPPGAREPVFNEADMRLDAEALEALIQELPPVSRQVFNLFALDGYSHAEIGQMLGMTESTSKWHVHFARKYIREHIIRLRTQTNSVSL